MIGGVTRQIVPHLSAFPPPQPPCKQAINVRFANKQSISSMTVAQESRQVIVYPSERIHNELTWVYFCDIKIENAINESPTQL